MKRKFTASVTALFLLGVVGLFTDGLRVLVTPVLGEAEQKCTYAFLYGEAVADAKAAPAGGFSMKQIKWMLGNADGTQFRPLVNKKNHREEIIPVGRTIIFKNDGSRLVLLGPHGKELELSLKQGPLADAKPGDLALRTISFSFSPDGKTLAFVNEAGNYCRINLDSMNLTIGKGTGLSQYDGIVFSDDGTRVAYSRHDAGQDTVFIADSDGQNEVKLIQSTEVKGFGFLPESRLGVVTKKEMITYDAKTGTKGDVVTWKEPLNLRSFGGFSPDGSAFIFDDGGPYHLSLHHMDMKTQKATTVKKQYLESFQRMAWVRVSVK